jgi:hypothetical protein
MKVKEKLKNIMFLLFILMLSELTYGQNKWKGVRLNVNTAPNGPIELYDLSFDIGEENNIADNHPEVINQIEAIMEKEHLKSDSKPFQFDFE